jgi:hypothetical protein
MEHSSGNIEKKKQINQEDESDDLQSESQENDSQDGESQEDDDEEETPLDSLQSHNESESIGDSNDSQDEESQEDDDEEAQLDLLQRHKSGKTATKKVPVRNLENSEEEDEEEFDSEAEDAFSDDDGQEVNPKDNVGLSYLFQDVTFPFLILLIFAATR